MRIKDHGDGSLGAREPSPWLLVENKKTEAQKSIEIEADARGVRLDVYVLDDENTVFDIEMQTTQAKDLAKRTRYYQGMIDLHLIERGANFKELKKSYVIFICREDPFWENLPVYTFENLCVEMHEIRLNDDTWKIFVNADGIREFVSDEMRSFLDYIRSGKPSDEFTSRIEGAVAHARAHKEWRLEYMTLMMRDQEMMEKGREEGLKEGEKRGEIIGAIRLYRDELHLSPSQIVTKIEERFSLSDEKAMEYVRNTLENEETGGAR